MFTCDGNEQKQKVTKAILWTELNFEESKDLTADEDVTEDNVFVWIQACLVMGSLPFDLII